jgi:hypothetical protein
MKIHCHSYVGGQEMYKINQIYSVTAVLNLIFLELEYLTSPELLVS